MAAERLAEPGMQHAEVAADGPRRWWSELRPAEGGRTQLVRRAQDGSCTDVLPEGYDALSRVHEYGGGAWLVHDDVVVFANGEDQRLYRLTVGDEAPTPLTPEPSVPAGLRYGDLTLPTDGLADGPTDGPTEGAGAGGVWSGSWVLAVRESHEPSGSADRGEPLNEVVAVPCDGSAAADPTRVRVLVSGPDFVASPRAAADRLAWVQWNHPNMPFDDTSLWVAGLRRGTDGPELDEPQRVAGGSDAAPESVMSPVWTPEGDLLFLSDRSGWWNLHRWTGSRIEHLGRVEADLGVPPWPLGKRDLALLADGRVVVVCAGGLGLVDPSDPGRPPSLLPGSGSRVNAVCQVVAVGPDRVLAVAGGPALAWSAVEVDLDGDVTVLRAQTGAQTEVDADTWSAGEPLTFRSAGGRAAYATFYPPRYPPRDPGVAGPEGAPPLVVMLHGGPTGQADPTWRAGVQFWTTRGFAVADVDYAGSTGYGREYRRSLWGQWGVRDVEDCMAVVRHLADAGRVDGGRAVIRGGSAGGFTVLAALTHRDNPFAAGCSMFGVADLMMLAQDTHKFESRYLDRLLGPLPDAEPVYQERSPVNHLDRLRVPILVLQGADDPVVPPEQSRMVVRAAAANGVDHEYLEFPGERHGFRRRETIARATEAELAFYRRVLRLPCG